MEYIGRLFDLGLNWRDAKPQGHNLPINDLHRKFKNLNNNFDGIEITEEVIMNEPEKVMELYLKDKRSGQAIASRMAKFEMDEIFERRDLLECLTQEEVGKVAFRKMLFQQTALLNLFKEKKRKDYT